MNKVGNVVLERGWRCLDCTVCEGCGKATDEGRLLLCDDCDISYHIYCLEPPLDHVPKGNWKCKWCVKCVKCGTSRPLAGYEWKNNYTECAFCYSLTQCHMCAHDYVEGDVIAKCTKCDRWCHVACEDQSTPAAAVHSGSNFACAECMLKERRMDMHLMQTSQFVPPQTAVTATALNQPLSDTLVFLEELANLTSKRNGCVLDEGIFLTDIGADLLKRIKIKPQPGPRRNRNVKSSSANINQIVAENDTQK